MPRLSRRQPPAPPAQRRNGAPRWPTGTPPAPGRAAQCAHGVPTGRGCAECAAVRPAGPHTVDERRPRRR